MSASPWTCEKEDDATEQNDKAALGVDPQRAALISLMVWRRRVGIEPTGAGFYRPPTDLKSAPGTSREAPPQRSYSNGLWAECPDWILRRSAVRPATSTAPSNRG